ncbi:MAG: F0F1 ATP synthase subunit delta, partial [Candidatus Kapaibacteriota bacterium]
MASSTRIAQRYALALMNQALSDGKMEAISADFNHVINAVNASDELIALLTSPVIRHDVKTRILKEVFSSNVSPLMMNFMILLTEKHR